MNVLIKSLHPAVFRLDVHIAFSAAGMKLDLGIIICFTLCHIFSGNLSGSQVQEVTSSLIVEYIRVKESLIQLFVHVHANSSVWLNVPGSQ